MQLNGKSLFLILILILVCIITCIFLYSNKRHEIEEFTSVADSGSKYFRENDPIFDNAMFYQLDLNTTDDITGYPKCLQNCDGVCVEYGLTGSAWCIPNDYSIPAVEDHGVPDPGIPRINDF